MDQCPEPDRSMSCPLHYVSHSPELTRELGRLLGQNSQAGDVFLLTGELGSGKTCLTQGIAWGLGVEGYVRSPTFVLITRYEGRLTLHHIDLFRIEGTHEALDLGLEEYISGDDICVVEWADRTPEAFPQDSTWIHLRYGAEESERLITIEAGQRRRRRYLEALKPAFEEQQE